MEKPPRKAYSALVLTADCLGGPRLPVEEENFHGLSVQHQYSLIKT